MDRPVATVRELAAARSRLLGIDALEAGRFNYRPGFGCAMCDFRQSHCARWAG